MQTSTFVADWLNGNIHVSAIHDYINHWHTTTGSASLAAFLGLTDEDYRRFVLDESMLPDILAGYRQIKQ